MREALTDVAALPPMQREAILMSAIDGRSHEEVASALGISWQLGTSYLNFGAALMHSGRVEEAVATCVRVRETIEPNPAWFPAYDSGYARFRTLYPAVHST